MSRQVLEIKLLNESAQNIYQNGSVLAYQTQGSSGFDIRANGIVTTEGNKIDLNAAQNGFILATGKRVQVQTGLAVAMNENYEIQVRSRSGLAWKNGIFVLNSPGTVDSDYRGELCVVLLNTGTEDFTIKLGDRIAQAVFCAVTRPEFIFVEKLDETVRGDGGYGSTGVK